MSKLCMKTLKQMPTDYPTDLINLICEYGDGYCHYRKFRKSLTKIKNIKIEDHLSLRRTRRARSISYDGEGKNNHTKMIKIIPCGYCIGGLINMYSNINRHIHTFTEKCNECEYSWTRRWIFEQPWVHLRTTLTNN